MKATQLEIFGMSADENHFTSTLWGVLTSFLHRATNGKTPAGIASYGTTKLVIVQSLPVLLDVPTTSVLIGKKDIFLYNKCHTYELFP